MSQCLLCQSASKVFHIKRHNNYDISYCLNCKFQFSNPMEDPGEVFYQQSHIYEDRSKVVQLGIPSDDWRYQTFFKLYISKPNQSLLDIGCGDGGFLVLAKNKGFDVFGIDIDSRAVYLAKNIRGLEHIECSGWENIEKIKGWKNFDVITLFDSLEHASSPISLVTTVFKLLKSGGITCIAVPRVDRYPKIFDIEVDYPPHHFTLWSSDALRALLANVGFKEIFIEEKPLIANDLYLHVIWRTRRFIRRLKKNLLTEKIINKMLRIIHPKIKIRADRIIRKLIFFILTMICWFLNKFYLGKGHTLLAMAKKPDSLLSP